MTTNLRTRKMALFRDCLHLKPGDIAALVGGGGKTTAMYTLGRELADEGVVLTTTTKIYPPDTGEADWIMLSKERDAPSWASRLAAEERCRVLVASELGTDGKLHSVCPDFVNRPDEGYLVVEADGSAGRPLKAPGINEPQIPPATTKVIPMIGVEAVDKPLTWRWCHRPEIASKITGIPLGGSLSFEDIATLVMSWDGTIKGKPPEAHVIPFINKVETEEDERKAEILADALLRRGAYSVGWGALSPRLSGNPRIVNREPVRNVSAVLLAAGKSERMGTPKQLLTIGSKTMLNQMLQIINQANVKEVVLVLGYVADEIRRTLNQPVDKVVVNPVYEKGQSSSLKTGAMACDPGSSALLFCLVDQPGISARVIDTLIEAYLEAKTKKPGQPVIVVPEFKGTRGNPVLMDRWYIPEMLELTGDEGARRILHRYPDRVITVETNCRGVLEDIDTMEDYEKSRQ